MSLTKLDLATKAEFRPISLVDIRCKGVLRSGQILKSCFTQIYREKDRFNYVCAVQELRGAPFDEAAHLTVER